MGLLEPEPVPIDVTGFRFQDRNMFKSRCLLFQCVPGCKAGLTNATATHSGDVQYWEPLDVVR